MMLLSQACLIHLSWPSAQRLMATRGLAQAWGRGPDSQQLEEHPRSQTPKSCLPTGAAGLIFLQQWPGGFELEAVPPSGLMLHVNTHHQGEGVPSRINQSCLLHRHWPLQRSSFSEGRKPPSVMVMPPPCPRNLKNNLFPLHFHAPPVLPCRQPTF